MLRRPLPARTNSSAEATSEREGADAGMEIPANLRSAANRGQPPEVQPVPPEVEGCRTTGVRAAPASSSRRTGVLYGALRAISGSSAASRRISPTASANASSVSRVSVSVGSTSRASSTSSGK